MSLSDLCREFTVSRQTGYRQVFHHERPHEGINNAVPASLYQSSSILLRRIISEFIYPRGFETRRVNLSGDVGWHKDRIFISQVFSFEDLGFEEMNEELLEVHFRDIELDELNVPELRFQSVRGLA